MPYRVGRDRKSVLWRCNEFLLSNNLRTLGQIFTAVGGEKDTALRQILSAWNTIRTAQEIHRNKIYYHYIHNSVRSR